MVVTGADGVLGRAVVLALRADAGLDVRGTALGWAAARELAALGVPTAVTDLTDPERLGAVLSGAHTVIHLAGPDPLATVGDLLEAARDTGLRRVVTVCPACDVNRAGLDGLAHSDYRVVVVTAEPAVVDPAVVAALVAADRLRGDRLGAGPGLTVLAPDDPLLVPPLPR
ncbi:MAG: NmrA family NAD(P)-binding protein [Actinomycetota bacterium]|nr:NmrA family NAD(P)-binding protein [Actinomycetota bacterium]